MTLIDYELQSHPHMNLRFRYRYLDCTNLNGTNLDHINLECTISETHKSRPYEFKTFTSGLHKSGKHISES